MQSVLLGSDAIRSDLRQFTADGILCKVTSMRHERLQRKVADQMSDSLRDKPFSKRWLTLLCQAVLILSPFIVLGAVSVITGHNAFGAWPVWTNELDTWRTLYNWDAVSLSAG